MPLTDFQREVFAVIKSLRSEESHVAGGTVLNSDPGSPRFSADVDIFHNVEVAVSASATKDCELLSTSGFNVTWLLRQPLFYRAVVSKNDQSIKLEWVYDSAFRFFPIVSDPNFGYCLHRYDAATNKVLAAANRNEVRDLIDLLYLDETWLPLGILIWSACGKDPGLTPDFIIDSIRRNSCVRQEQLDLEKLAVPLTPVMLKTKLYSALDVAGRIISELPAEEIGACYVTISGEVVTPSRLALPHYGTVRGAWPREYA